MIFLLPPASACRALMAFGLTALSIAAAPVQAQAITRVTVQNDSMQVMLRVSSSAGTAFESAPAPRVPAGGSDDYTVTARDAGSLQGSATYASADGRQQCRFVYGVTARGAGQWGFEQTATSVGSRPISCRGMVQAADARTGAQSLLFVIR